MISCQALLIAKKANYIELVCHWVCGFLSKGFLLEFHVQFHKTLPHYQGVCRCVNRSASRSLDGQYLSSDACLVVKREDNQNCSVLCCVRQLCTMISTLG